MAHAPDHPTGQVQARSLRFGVGLIDLNERVVAADKPAGLHLGSTRQGEDGRSVIGALVPVFRAERVRPQQVRPLGVVEPLASGACVFDIRAVPRQTGARPTKVYRVQQTFLALLAGELPAEPGATRTVRTPVPDARGHVRAATTQCRVLGSGSGLTLVQLRTRGGALGQVLQHAAELGAPILGDPLRHPDTGTAGRPGLHCLDVLVTDERSEETRRYGSPAPGVFYTAVGLTPPSGSPAERSRPRAAAPPRLGDDAEWDPVADWYDQLVTSSSDHHDQVVVPGVLRLLDVLEGERVLDVACGQGVLSRELAQRGARVTGIDASSRLIELARARPAPGLLYEVADARSIGERGFRAFDAVACVLALMNIDPLSPVIEGIASALRPGGRCVLVLLHPAFRVPQHSSWNAGVDQSGEPMQGRVVDRYLSHLRIPIVMNPGAAAAGAEPVTTTTFHRPIGAYVSALARAGLMIDTMEEWTSRRRSEPGPRAEAENRARREFPLFLAVRAIRPAGGLSPAA